MSTFSTILNGYVMVLLVYIGANFPLFFGIRDRLRVPWWVVLALTVMESVAVRQALRVHWAGHIVVVSVFFLLFCRLVNVKPTQFLYLTMVVVAYGTACHLILFMVCGCSCSWAWRETVWMLGVYVLTVPLMCVFLRRVIWPRLARLTVPDAKWLGIVSVLLITLDLLIGTSHVQHLLAGYKIVTGFSMLLAVLSTTAAALMALIIVGKKQAEAKYRNELHIVGMQMASQARRYAEMSRNMDEIRIMRHDLRHHLRVASMLLNDDRLESLRDFLKELEGDHRLHDNILHSRNYVSDLIAHHTLRVAKAAGIDTIIHCGLPESFWIADSDLCALLGNLMENALNACRLQTEGRREIVFTAVVQGGEALVHVENTCGDPALDTPENRKRKGMRTSSGYGLPSICAIASKYNGIATFDRQRGRFSATVLLYDAKKASNVSQAQSAASEIIPFPQAQ